MFPPSFDYERADTVEEALSLLADHADRDARVVAGGQGIVPSMKLGEADPGVLVDVAGVDELGGVRPDGDELVVGACVTHAELVDAGGLADHAPALASTAPHVADPQVRNRGTLGGNLAEADPAADWPAAVVAADATLAVRNPGGERTVDAGEFFRGPGETALDGGELLVAVRVPGHDRGAYAKKTHPATGYAMVGVAVALDAAHGQVADVRVAANGVADRAVRLPSVEDAVRGEPVGDVDPAEAAADAADDVAPGDARGGVHASGGFRRELLAPYAERALASALA